VGADDGGCGGGRGGVGMARSMPWPAGRTLRLFAVQQTGAARAPTIPTTHRFPGLASGWPVHGRPTSADPKPAPMTFAPTRTDPGPHHANSPTAAGACT
jgi:hypothetical protein